MNVSCHRGLTGVALLSALLVLVGTSVECATLTFEQRIHYQRAIETVYWRHRIWPAQNKSRKPDLNAIISESLIRGKVIDYLRKSTALEKYWGRPITATQLQGEVERMITQSRDRAMLSELFAALDNNPSVIEECLARPLLADRLINHWYSYDKRFHGTLKTTAQRELASVIGGSKPETGLYQEFDRVKGNPKGGEAPGAVFIASQDWTAEVGALRKLYQGRIAHTPDSPPVGPFDFPFNRWTALQETEESFYSVSIKARTSEHIRSAVLEWKKTPFRVWWQKVKEQAPSNIQIQESIPQLPIPLNMSPSCTDDTWTPTYVGAPTGRDSHVAVWTGTELIVWGGYSITGFENTGGRYDPSTDTWTSTDVLTAPSPRELASAVWTGTEMIVWGGMDPSVLNTGGRYNPTSDSWLPTDVIDAPDPRQQHTAIWTGTKMIVWGGVSGDYNSRFDTGGIYDPLTDMWAPTNPSNAPSPRVSHTAIWTGSKMIVWGGLDNSDSPLNTGGRYDIVSDSWLPTDTTSTFERAGHTAVWTGSEMITWGGWDSSSNTVDTGQRYNPDSDNWSDINPGGAPEPRSNHVALWTGSRMIVWGGWSGASVIDTGGRYDPVSNGWEPTNTLNAPEPRQATRAVWSGTEMIVWGGYGDAGPLNSGGRYDPLSNTWISTSASSAPSARFQHTAIWTGAEMIIWGGADQSSAYTNTGKRYDPSTGAWTDMDQPNFLEPRILHTAVWTGTEMLVWGGGYTQALNNGGRYNPATDTFFPISSTRAPVARLQHAAVWTGSEMIIWGGFNFASLSSGARYDPLRDRWTAMAEAPQPRFQHTAVWTGAEMIEWGGNDGYSDVNTGQRYNPALDTWGSIENSGAPDPTSYHTAVWTGSEMLIWGGNGSYPIGARYDPTADSWTSIDTTNTSARLMHTAVWTGAEMIVWGGSDNLTLLNSGERYDPDSDAWTSVNTSDAPLPRYSHTAVWTGAEMIVWGGYDALSVTSTGGQYCAAASLAVPLFLNDASFGEGNSGTSNAIFTVSLSAASQSTVMVDFTTSNGTASAPADYLSTTGTVIIPAGQTSATFTVSIVGDTSIESDETFTVILSNPVNATLGRTQGAGAIYNDDGITVSISDSAVLESIDKTVNAIFTVNASALSGSDITVTFNTADGTATAASDYVTTSGTVTIPARSISEDLTVPILSDSVFEPSETFVVNLSNPSGASILDGQGTGTITNAQEQWLTRFPNNTNAALPSAMVLDPNGFLDISGDFDANSNRDFVTLKYDLDGSLSSTWPDTGLGAGVRLFGGFGEEEASDIAVDAGSNVFVTGYTASAPTNDFLTLKYDSSGNLSSTWPSTGYGSGVRRYNGPGNGFDRAVAVKVDSSGNTYVVGRSTGSGTGVDIAVLKYDSDGNGSTTWPDTGAGVGVRRYTSAGNSEDRPTAMAVDNNGNVYVTGYTQLPGFQFDYVTLKIDTNGDFSTTWPDSGNGAGVRVYHNGGTNLAYDIAVDDDGNVFVTGDSGSECLTIHYDGAGNLSSAWPDAGAGTGMRRFTGFYTTAGKHLRLPGNGNLYLSGDSFGPTLDDYFILHYDSNGNASAPRYYNGPGNLTDRTAAMAVDASGNSWMTGDSGADYGTVKLDSNGNFSPAWPDVGFGPGVRMYDGPFGANDFATAIVIDSGGNAYVTGWSFSGPYAYDIVTIKYTNGDIDADGTYDVADCSPLNSSLWALPTSVRNLTLTGAATTVLDWIVPSNPGGASLVYDVLRSSNPADFNSAICLETNGADTTAADSAAPPSGSVFFYIIASENDCGRNLGQNSGLTPRTGVTCP